MELAGRVVAITGAASGIGRALAAGAVERGAHVALSDVDEAGLTETAASCTRDGIRVSHQVVDVADRTAMTDWAEETRRLHGDVHMIVNNAGVTVAATASAIDIDEFERLMHINFWGVVHGTHAFLPHLRQADQGHIVNISSVFGLVSIPGQSAYNASKFAVRGFSDALRIELEIERAGVSVTTIHPGGIDTSIVRNARIDDSMRDVGVDTATMADEFQRVARTSPQQAAEKILRSVEKNRRRALIGPDAVAFDLVSRLPAGLYQRLLIWDGRRNRS